MNRPLVALAIALAVFSVSAAQAGSYRTDKASAQLGSRFDSPVKDFKVGSTVRATVLDASKLRDLGLRVNSSDKLEVQRLDASTVMVRHVATNVSRKFSVDTEGNIALAR